MKLRSVHGLVVTAAAVGLLAGCTGGGAEAPRSVAAPASATVTSSATSSAASGPAAMPGKPVAPNVEPAGSIATTRPAPRKPVIGRVWTTPRLACDGTACTLSPPVGTVIVHARVSGATSVEFVLVPTGTDTAGYGRSIGLDRDGRDGWTATYSYPDEPLWSHLTVVARGPGGRADALPFNLYHPQPLGPAIGRVWTEPALSCRDVWCTLPAGAGTITIHADVRDALGGVEFSLVPTGGGTPVLLGTADDRGQGYSVTWSYPDAPLNAYVRVSAGNNVGHRSSTALGLIHS